MSDLLADGMTTLASKLKSYAGKTGTYRRGANSVSITGTLAHQILRVSDHGHTRVERADADFVFSAADLIISGAVVEPNDDTDTIDFTFGSTTKRFRLLPMNRGQEPAWRYSDAHQTMIRAHLKFTGTV